MIYRTIVADPPWNESGGGRIRRGADKHYPLIKEPRKIAQVMLDSGMWSPDPCGCHLYLWATNNHLIDAIEVIKHVGFRYITNIVWVKDRFGIGKYFRGQHELCLFAVQGPYLPTASNSLSTLIHAKRRAHSQKPEEFYKLVEDASPDPRLELFARIARSGWDSWGNEVNEVADPVEGTQIGMF
jgi:N6-adenosine-specific RNA methylase IME4